MADILHPGRKILFQHVPCTGGSELFSVLEIVYGRTCAALYHDDPARVAKESLAALAVGSPISFVAAHFNPIGPLADHVDVWTFYRDPVERTLSQHFYGRRMAAEKGRPVKDIPPRHQWPDAMYPAQNHYLRWACRIAGMDLALDQAVDGRALAIAQAVIDRGYAGIGITESFQDSLRLMATKLQWPSLPPSTPQTHVMSGRDKTESLDPETVAWARHVTRFDQILYTRAVARFDRDRAAFVSP